MSTVPTLRVLSLGAGVQSTALLILAARGDLEPLDYAIFADTGWEPAAVYAHLDRIEREVAAPAGIKVLRVSAGHIRNDALDPNHRFASMPLYVKAAPDEPCPACGGSGAHPDGGSDHVCGRPTRDGVCCKCGGDGKAGDGMGRRQCTNQYKLTPLKASVRGLLGAPDVDGAAQRVPAGRFVEQWIGISVDEAHRALDSKSTRYMPARWPLLERGLSRADCMAINTAAGFPDTPKSACIGCPYHRNHQWRDLRDNHPSEWADAVDFDRKIRGGAARANAQGQKLRGQMYLHESRVPLDQAPIDRVTRREWTDRQTDLLTELSALAVTEAMDGEAEVFGCGPHACRIPGDEGDAA